MKYNTIFSKSVVVSSKRGIPFLPGLLLIALGAVVLIAPRLVLAVLAIFLLSLGTLFCYLVYKFMALRKQINNLTMNFESSLFGAHKGTGFKGSKYSDSGDIDITDLDSFKKIVYH
jgi:hypothetical protein